MGQNVAQKLIASHLVDGEMRPGEEIGLSVDQTLTQDATGTMVMLELEAMGLDRVRTELSAQYVDHNLLQADYPQRRRPPVPAAARASASASGTASPATASATRCTCSASASRARRCSARTATPARPGSLGMLAIGAGGLEVAMAMAGEPFHLRMPQIWGVRLVGELPDWVSAKDVILEMLRRHDVTGGLGRIIEYHGSGPARALRDGPPRDRQHGRRARRDHHGVPVRRRGPPLPARPRSARTTGSSCAPTPTPTYDIEEEIDLSTLEPLIALPSSPGNVVPVREVAGRRGLPVRDRLVGEPGPPRLRDRRR